MIPLILHYSILKAYYNFAFIISESTPLEGKLDNMSEEAEITEDIKAKTDIAIELIDATHRMLVTREVRQKMGYKFEEVKCQ